ncbi:MAG TPA: hypothetical protein ACHBZ9_03675 [Arsenophonus nasoniae]|uniref:hypothetical protein n=1 Tax=Arsenophonus nasoniae TaxID=638 RepID=UPI0038791A1A
MVQFSENIKNVIKKIADKKHVECELVPYQMDINENGFFQDIPSGLEPYKLESKQAKELLRLIDVHDDAIFSITLNQSIDDKGNNYSDIEFTRTTFHFYLVYSGIHELHILMNNWKSKGVDIVAVSIKNNDCTGV